MSRQSIQAGKAVIVVDLVDKATQSFKKMQSGIMNASRAFRDIGTNTAGAALLTGVPIVKGLATYARFTNEIQNIEAKLGNFGKTSSVVRQNSIELRNEIIKLGRDTAYTSEEVAKAAGVLAQGGLEEFGAGTIKASLKSIIDLGRGTALALEDAANMAVSLATTFKVIKPGDTTANVTSAMTTLADQIVKAGRLSIAGADDIGASLVYVAQKANDLGVTVPEVLALLNQLAQAGIKGSVAGTSLNTAFGNLSNNLEKIKKTFPDFDIIFKDNGSVDAIETFGRLGQLMKGMSVIAKTKFLQDIFNLRGERAASALEDLEGMRKGYQQIRDSADEAAKSAQTMQAGFGGALERMTGAVDALQIKLGVRFDKVLKGSTEIIALMIDKVSELSIKYLALTATILLSPVIFAATAVGALSLSFILARLSVVVGLVLKGFKGLKSVGSIMLGGAKSLASPLAAMANTRSIKAAAIKKISAKIAALQTALDISYAKASAKKVGAASAIAKIAASKKQAQLVSAVLARQKLLAGTNLLGGLSPAKLLSKYSKLGVSSKKLISGGIAGASFLGGLVPTSGKEASIALKNIAEAFGVLGKSLTNYKAIVPAAIKLSAMLGNAIQGLGQSKSLAGIKSLIGYIGQVKVGLVTGYVPYILNTAKLFKGIELFQGGKIAKTITGIAQLAFSFGRLSLSLTRFIFSWNFVGLALNALLLFGDRIPTVRKAFSDLGAAFSSAFREIGKIATYAVPAFNLFGLAIEAFSSGNSEIGIGALAAGFNSIVSIISNQLTAAWLAFSGKVSVLWISLKSIGMSIMTIFNSIVGSITSVVSSISERLVTGLSGIEIGGGSGNIFQDIILGLDSFITGFGMVIITLNEYLLKFLDRVQIVFGEIISKIPGTGSAGADIVEEGKINSAITDITSMFYRSRLRVDATIRARELKKTFSEKPNDNKDAIDDANLESESASNYAAYLYQKFLKQLTDVTTAATADAQAAATKKPFEENTEQGGDSPEVNRFVTRLDALVGSLGQTRNIYQIEKPTTVQELKKQTALLEGIKGEIRTQGGVGN